jgi:uncharacterized protein with PIN domain
MGPAAAKDSSRCAACGGRLSLVVAIHAHGRPTTKDSPRTRYFKCNSCTQIQIVED